MTQQATARSVSLNLRDALTLAVTLCQDGKLDQAERLYRSVLQQAPRQFDALLNLGKVYLQQGEPGKAIELLQQAAAVNPQVADAQAEAANALSALGRHDEAVRRYRQALASRPDDPDTQARLGIALQLLERHEEAIPAYREAIARRPNFPAAHNNLGTALGRVGKLDDAIESFRAATALDPEFADPWANLAAALRRRRRFEEALAAYRHWLRLQPEAAAGHDTLGLTLQALGRYDEALAAHRAALAIAPGSAAAYHNLGNALFNLNRHEEAVACYRRSIALKPDYALAYANMGLTLEQLGRRDEALAAFEKSIELAPETVEFHYKMMDAKRFAPGDPQIATLERIAETIDTRSGDDQVKLHFVLAKAYDDQGERQRAFDHLRRGNSLMQQKLGYQLAETRQHFRRIREVFTPELMRDKGALGHPSQCPVFVIGMPRSGTTLVEQILASHPRVFAAGELSNFADALAAAKDGDGRPLSYPDFVPGADRRRLFELGAAYLAGLPMPLPLPDRLIDKMPGNFTYAGLIHLVLPHARIVHLRRDPLDTCYSCYSKLFLYNHEYSYSLEDLGGYYREYETLMAHWRALLSPEVMLEVQYEELVADFEPQARRLLGHCGLEWDDRCLAFHEAARAIRTPSSSQVRRPLYASSVGRWRNYQDWLGPLIAALER